MNEWVIAGTAIALTAALMLIIRDKTDAAVMAVVLAMLGLVALWWWHYPT